jgi:hypothetical protein
MPDKCSNCERVIGNLEQPFVWNEHVVCAECYNRLNSPRPVEPPAEARLFLCEGAMVTTKRVAWSDGQMQLNQILSVGAERRLFSFSMNVYLTDLVQRRSTIILSSADIARDFIAALVRANGSIQIEREQWAFFVSW